MLDIKKIMFYIIWLLVTHDELREDQTPWTKPTLKLPLRFIRVAEKEA
jgi:hypothetical protein